MRGLPLPWLRSSWHARRRGLKTATSCGCGTGRHRSQRSSTEYRAAFSHVVLPGESATLRVAREELLRGLRGLLDRAVTDGEKDRARGRSSPEHRKVRRSFAPCRSRANWRKQVPRALSFDDAADQVGAPAIAVVIAANTDVGVLYGVFHLLRQLDNLRPINQFAVIERPARWTAHAESLGQPRSLRGTRVRRPLVMGLAEPAGLDSRSGTATTRAPTRRSGINGTVLTNVNANARALTPEHLAKVAALANVFRPYGIKVYLTARFNAPMELGALPTADPLDANVRAWWRAKADEIYRLIPDFGGFLVKANSEGQPGPQDYRARTPTAPTCWPMPSRRTVASSCGARSCTATMCPVDRIKQAYDEFTPLDGRSGLTCWSRSRTGRSTSSLASRSIRCSARCRRRR